MADEPIPSIAVLPPAPPKRIHGLTGRKPTEKQMEGLKKGMEALKQKREAIKVKKAEKKAKQKAGIPIDDSSEDEAPAPKKEAEAPKHIIQYIPVKAKPPRKDAGLPRPPKNYVMRDDFEAFKTSILDTIKTTGVIKEVSVPVDRIVEKETIKEVPVHTTKVLTGSDLLNAIFKFN
jgi:hypothetical protein